MTLKAKMSLLVFLTSLSIVSIGFSSWSITAETTAEIGGNIEVDNVIESTKYLKYKSHTIFSYNEDGFLDANNNTVYVGNFQINYTLDINECKNLFGSEGDLKLDIDIHLPDDIKNSTSLLSLNMFSKITASIKKDGVNCVLTSNSYSRNNLSISTTLTNFLEQTIDSTIVVNYSFNITDINFFKTISDVSNIENTLYFGVSTNIYK